MNEMIERVARVIAPEAFDRTAFDARADYFTKPGDFEAGQERARAKARAVIEAMREPTEAMMGALAHVAGCIHMPEPGWRAAIDEALKP